jgi:hypothetical protein
MARDNTDIVLKLLEENFAEVRDVRRLDQQLVYVPLAALAGGLYAILANRGAIPPGVVENGWLRFVLTLLGALVWFGLLRNSFRHHELLMRRRELLEKLPITLQRLEIDWPFWLGRAVYFALFTLGLGVLGTIISAILP